MKKEEIMNKDKVMTFRVSPKEYEQIKNRCEKSGYKKTSTYIRKKVLGDSDEMLLSYENVIQLYDRLSKLEGEFEEIKMFSGLSEYELDDYSDTLKTIDKQISELKI